MKLSLLTDLYELTMLEGYYQSGSIDRRAVFDVFFREAPFNGSYAVFAGLEKVIAYLTELSFDDDDIAYLRSLNLFSGDFLDYLRGFRFDGDVYSFPEGSIIFPQEPILRIEGALGEAQLVETAVLNFVNFQTLIASKAARICSAARELPVIEFGLRRSQGEDGGLSASRASFVGGCEGTSNVLAGKMFGIPVRGTHAHSWVMSFDSELEAFRAYARVYPDNAILLVDTYDSIRSGIPNAITVARDLQKEGHRLVGIRLDSGDIVSISKQARQMLDEADLDYVKILVSGDLDEYRIDEMLREGAPVDSFGVGTRLATGHQEAALTGVYKMAAMENRDGAVIPKMKTSDELIKGTLPGIKNVFRFFKDGTTVFDVICRDDETPGPGSRIFDLGGSGLTVPEDVTGVKQLLPIVQEGKPISESPSLVEIQHACRDGFRMLPERYRAITDADVYPVMISESVFTLWEELRGAVV